jgi:hypothetical protein
MLKLATELLTNTSIKRLKNVDPVVEEEVFFEGSFTLNEFVHPQTMMLKGNYLRFAPSG